MNITNKDYEILNQAIDLLETADLPKGSLKTVYSARSVMDGLKQKKEKDNKRIAKYIADKRKENKNYARTPYIKKGGN